MDLEVFSEGEPVPLPPTPAALFVGVLELYKNVDGLARVWRLVVHRLPAAQLRIVGRHPQHGFVADDILGCHLPIHIAGERRAIAIVRRQKLKPQIAHLVLRSLAPGDARRRLLRIADVLRGVVERVFH